MNIKIKKKAQAGLEYLMTYGWALILIVTVVAVLWMLIGTPKSNLNFTSSSPTKILIKAGNVAGNNVEIQVINATGKRMELSGIYPLGYSNCTVDSASTPITINSGKTMKINCTSPTDGKGCVAMQYTDNDNYEKGVTISSDNTKNCQTQLDPGGPADPLELMDCQDLQEIENDLDAYYILTNDIDCSATAGWNGGAGFVPISFFQGSLDGQGRSITNLNMGRNTNGQAMFNFNTGTIKNLSLSGFNIRCFNEDVAALVLQNAGTVENITMNNNSLESFQDAGGLVEYNNATGIIRNSTLNNTTINSFRNIGGLVLFNAGLIENSESNNLSLVVFGDQIGGFVLFNQGTINNSHSTGTIDQTLVTGGFVLQNVAPGIINNSFSTIDITNGNVSIGGFAMSNSGTINNSYSTGDITCVVSCGGFAATNSGTINDSYSTGAILASNSSGGFVQWNGGTINRSYATGLITCPCTGGLVLSNSGACANSFWDTQTSTKVTSACGTGKTTAQMKLQATFDPPWDFVNNWKISAGDYPRLKWQ